MMRLTHKRVESSGGDCEFTIHPEIENKLRALADAEGIPAEQYLERLIQSEHDLSNQVQLLALQGLGSGEAFETGTQYWEEKHRRLDERLQKTRR